MSDYGFPWDSENIGTEEKPILDRAYEAEQLQGVFKRFFSNGVFADSNDALQAVYSVVEPTNEAHVWVKSGWCHINGVFKHFDEDTPITYEPLENPTAQTKRVDFVVLRWDAVARDITIDVKKGVQYESGMAYPPALTRNELVWELGIAKISQAIGSFDVTDNRLSPTDCGFVAPFEKIDTSSLLQRLQDEMDATVEAYQDAVDGTLAGNLQTQIDTINANGWVTKDRLASKSVTESALSDALKNVVPRIMMLDVDMTVNAGSMEYLNIAPAGVLESSEIVVSCCLCYDEGHSFLTLGNPIRASNNAWFARILNNSQDKAVLKGKLYSVVLKLSSVGSVVANDPILHG